MTPDGSQLRGTVESTNCSHVKQADGSPLLITHHGTLSTSRFYVPDVALIPHLSMNLMSVGQLASLKCFVGFDEFYCYVQDLWTGRLIGTGRRLLDHPE